MPIDYNIPLMAGRGVTPLQTPLESRQMVNTVRAQDMANQAERMKMEDDQAARAIFRESQGDFRKAAELATSKGLMGHAAKFQEAADNHDRSLLAMREAATKMTDAQKKDALERIQEVGKFSKWVLSVPPEQRQAAFDQGVEQLGQFIPELGRFQGKQLDPDLLARMASQADAFGAVLTQKPLTDVGKLNAALRSGEITQAQYDQEIKMRNTPRQPLVQVGYSQPFEVTDPNTNKPILVQQDKQGNIRPVAGYAPRDGSEKPLTEAQGNALGFGIRAREANAILNDLETKGVNPGTLKNKAASAVPILGNYAKSPAIQSYEQAQRNFVTAVLRKESGAAISAGEFDTEAKKYFPQPGDSKETLEQKANARKTAIEVLQLQAGREIPATVKAVKPKAPSKASLPAALAGAPKSVVDDYLAGYEVTDPNGKKYKLGGQ